MELTTPILLLLMLFAETVIEVTVAPSRFFDIDTDTCIKGRKSSNLQDSKVGLCLETSSPSSEG